MRVMSVDDGRSNVELSHLDCNAVFSVIGVARLLQLALGCVTLSLLAHTEEWLSSPYGRWCMFVSSFCFAVTLLIVLIEVSRLSTGVFLTFWSNITVSFCTLAWLMYITVSILYPLEYLHLECHQNAFCPHWRFRLAASVLSAINCFAYGFEVLLSHLYHQEPPSFMATIPGLLKMLQVFVACIIFGALNKGSHYEHYAATQWCVAIYSLCFTFSTFVVVFNLSGLIVSRWTNVQRLLAMCSLLAVLLYASAAVIWPVFSFDHKYGHPERNTSCVYRETSCIWDNQLAVAVLTFVNLVLYTADLLITIVHFVRKAPNLEH
uniref:Myeloid-associated differentiation marker-like protein 2 n=1 Tax=Eptatretus burgeri TaxID=7764 RepID=A0A8C4WW74_EPTBU